MAAEAELVRFVIPGWKHRESQAPIGVLGAAYQLLREDRASAELATALRSSIDWFERTLPVPDRFNRTTSKGWYRRETRGIAWLRVSATEHVTAMRALAEAIGRCGHPVTELRTQRPGYVVYEDELQVVAEPFRDTPTR